MRVLSKSKNLIVQFDVPSVPSQVERFLESADDSCLLQLDWLVTEKVRLRHCDSLSREHQLLVSFPSRMPALPDPLYASGRIVSALHTRPRQVSNSYKFWFGFSSLLKNDSTNGIWMTKQEYKNKRIEISIACVVSVVHHDVCSN